MKWVNSNGGPLVAIPEGMLSAWRGAGDDEEREDDDYERASNVEDYAGLIPVGNGTALVLGDDPAPTTYVGGLSVLVRRLAAVGESIPLSTIEHAMASASWESAGQWEVPGRVVLFDAAFAPEDLEATGSLVIELQKGRYTVESAYVEADADTWLVLVRLRREENQ